MSRHCSCAGLEEITFVSGMMIQSAFDRNPLGVEPFSQTGTINFIFGLNIAFKWKIW